MLIMSNIEIGSENDSSVWSSEEYRDPYGEQDASYIAGSNNVLGHTSSMNPVRWEQTPGYEAIPYLIFAPHCENCGRPVEFFEGMPYWWIYALQRFLCAEYEDLDYGYFLSQYRKVQSGEWTEEQAEKWVQSLYDDDGPYYF
jgi:hypothetical protein